MDKKKKKKKKKKKWGVVPLLYNLETLTWQVGKTLELLYEPSEHMVNSKKVHITMWNMSANFTLNHGKSGSFVFKQKQKTQKDISNKY